MTPDRAGQLSLSFLLWLFRWVTVPWPHFLLAFAAAVIFTASARRGGYAWASVAAFGAATLLSTGLTSVWARRKMGHG